MSDQPSHPAADGLTYPEMRALVQAEIEWHLEVASRQSHDREHDYRMAGVHGHRARELAELLFRAALACDDPGASAESSALRDTTHRRFEAIQAGQRARQRKGSAESVNG